MPRLSDAYVKRLMKDLHGDGEDIYIPHLTTGDEADRELCGGLDPYGTADYNPATEGITSRRDRH